MADDLLHAIAPMLATSWLQPALDWLSRHQEWLWWVGAGSLSMMILGALLLPWLICRLPEDFFTTAYVQRRCAERQSHTWLSILLLVLRNGLGIVLLLAGIAMLFLPGQGVLTILIGLLLLSLPSKRKIVCAVAGRRSICRPLNWVRKKRGRAPFEGLGRRNA